jgi:hypothetical protein
MSESKPQWCTLSSSDWQQLMEDKQLQRQRLLSLSPQQAQAQVDQLLSPQAWQLDTDQLIWNDTLPTEWDEIYS